MYARNDQRFWTNKYMYLTVPCAKNQLNFIIYKQIILEKIRFLVKQ